MASASPSQPPCGAAPADRILWRCRRGMKELDLLLERFAREHYPHAPAHRKRAFERMLDLPDPTLAALLLGPPAASRGAPLCGAPSPRDRASPPSPSAPPTQPTQLTQRDALDPRDSLGDPGHPSRPERLDSLDRDRELDELAALVAAPRRR